ncbi:MAG: sigma-54-dependent Fis family transcriptional regulator, partial [Arcobacter butzleri]|nr:sigma-54-dependent Fis family transcriptional regulator [Aliarcobacter butzleri]
MQKKIHTQECSKDFFLLYEISLRLLVLNNYQDSISKSLRILKDTFKFKKCDIYIKESDGLTLFASSVIELEPEPKEYKEARLLSLKSQEKIVIDKELNKLFLNKSKKMEFKNVEFFVIPFIYNYETIGVLSIALGDDADEEIEKKIEFLDYIATLYRYALYSNLEKDYKIDKYKELKKYYERELDFSFYDILAIDFIDEPMINLKNDIIKIASSDLRVLIAGEVGTEKLTIATTIHKLSHRQHKPLVIIKSNTYSSPELEVEIFGYKFMETKTLKESKIGKIELAENGTLVIEDIDKLPINIVKKFLLLFKDKSYKSKEIASKYNARIIATASLEVLNRVKTDKFFKEFIELLNFYRIDVPALRDRRGDIKLFINNTLDKYNFIHNKKLLLSDEAMEILKEYPYNTNIKELERNMEKLVYSVDDTHIKPKDLIDLCAIGKKPNLEQNLQDICFKEKTLEEIEKEVILNTLKKYDNNQTEAAKRLGITLRQIGYKIKNYKLTL